MTLGKLNLHEFAYGGTSDVSYFGPVHNPWALDHSSRRILRGLRRSRSRRSLLWHARHGYSRVDSHAVLILRSSRIQAHLWARKPARRHSAFLVA